MSTKVSPDETSSNVAGRRRPRVKVCRIRSELEARLALLQGAHALGIATRDLSEPRIAALLGRMPCEVETFLRTEETDPRRIAALHGRVPASALQLGAAMDPGDLARLRDLLPTVGLVQMVPITGPEALDEACAAAEHVDALLLDSAPGHAPRGGRVHDWSVSRWIVESVERPVWLAGGLRAGNVAEAVELVSPFGLDLGPSVRSKGSLDPTKLAAFFEALERCAG